MIYHQTLGPKVCYMICLKKTVPDHKYFLSVIYYMCIIFIKTCWLIIFFVEYHNNRGQSDVSTISYPPSYIEGPVPQPPRQQLASQPRPTRNSVNPQRQQQPPPGNQVPPQSQQAQTGRVHGQSQRQHVPTRVTQPQQPTPRWFHVSHFGKGLKQF